MAKLSDIFYIFTGSKLDFDKQIIDENGINFVSRNSNNNGVVGKVLPAVNAKIYKKGDITVPLGGSYLLSAFVQNEDFVTAQNVDVLRPKKEMSEKVKWFYCYVLRENRFKFSAFGREVNKYIHDIEVPDEIPDWVENGVMELPKTNNLNNVMNLKKETWEWFNIGGENGIFSIEPCKCSNASALLDDGEEIEYIGAKKEENGFMRKVIYDQKFVTKGNCIVFICDGQGSVGYTNYMPKDFIGSTTLCVGRNECLNEYNGLFIVTVLDMERAKYSYGRKYKSNIPKIKIKLPCVIENDIKKPDWKFMENYIKSLPYGDCLEQL